VKQFGSKLQALVLELRRRRVIRAAGIYLVAGWVVVEVTATVFPLLGFADWATRLVLAVTAAGFPVALWLAWVLEIVPEGVRVEGSQTGIAEKHLRISQAVLIAAATVVGLAIPAFIILQGRDRPADVPAAEKSSDPGLVGRFAGAGPDRSVAVLPFRNLSDDPDNEYFSQGITQEIVTRLAGTANLRVLSPPMADSDEVAAGFYREVGVRFGTGFVLDGSVQRAGGRVRVAAKLTDSRSGQVVWADDFDRDLTVEDIFRVQSQVAVAVANALKAEVAPGRTADLGRLPTENLSAYDHYLRGNYDLARRTPASVTRAIAEYREASNLDPEFIAASAREAYAYALFIDWGWTSPFGTPETLLERGLQLTDAALAKDSSSAGAWLARAYLLVQRDPYRLEDALPAFERAITLDPSDAEIYHQYGQSLMILGRYAEAASAYHGALALEPTRAMTLVPLSALSALVDDFNEALRWADSAVSVGHDLPYPRAVRAGLRLETGDLRGAQEDAEAALRIDPSYAVPTRAVLASALYQLGDIPTAERELERARQALVAPDAPSPTDALYYAATLVAMNRPSEAVAFVERVQPRGAWLWFYLQHPGFTPIRDDPRFQQVVQEADPRIRVPSDGD